MNAGLAGKHRIRDAPASWRGAASRSDAGSTVRSLPHSLGASYMSNFRKLALAALALLILFILLSIPTW
ncbi:MAG TPA: hypothetical protein VLA61_14435 [Ideonella sp.]|uniref:hypothetical protein n=1 Tax=Ideonella sp. TaxID=1929293 RepID=UPI002B5F7980|nr:hypothetical protein [Ideonella sp.]HSI49469.1 hypothetical protein [Ideonella sp.]